MAAKPGKNSPETEEQTEIRHVSDLAEGDYPCLQVVSGPGRGNRYRLHSGKNLLGRNEIADISLDDSSISRDHAEIEIRGDAAIVRDLGSRNGTYVAGKVITSDTPITHRQRLKIGIYDFQFLTEAAELPPEDSQPEEGEEAEAPPSEVETPAQEEAPEVPAEAPPPAPEVPAEQPPAAPPPVPAAEGVPPSEAVPGRWGRLLQRFPILQKLPPLLRTLRPVLQRLGKVPRKWYYLGAALIVAGVVGLYAVNWIGSLLTGEAPPPPPEIPVETGVAPEPQAAPAVPAVTVPEYVPVFLDFTSEPISATVFFGEESVGTTPFRMSANLQYGRTYEVRAQFALDDIGEVLEERLRFALGADQQVIPLNFAAPIGSFKIKSLPRGVDLYLEGFFASDPHRAKPIKFYEMVFDKPFFLPYGRYVLELKQSRQLSESKTFISEVIYRREFTLDQEHSQFETQIKEKDLKSFPALIRSQPEAAQVLIDGAEKGLTPFSGELALGEHRLVIRKEGFFEHEQTIQVDLNAPFELDVELKTSTAGLKINEARIQLRQQRYKDAINTLIDALKEEPTTQEIAEIHYLIGQSYLYMGSYQEAQDYFTQAMRNEFYRYPARLGISQIFFAQGERIKALQVLVEVLIKAKRDQVRSDAGQLFQKISPFKSVLYITTVPEGAQVVVNDKAVGVTTPLILHDLLVGVYRIQVSKPGYEPLVHKVDLGVAEFKPVVIELNEIASQPDSAP